MAADRLQHEWKWIDFGLIGEVLPVQMGAAAKRDKQAIDCAQMLHFLNGNTEQAGRLRRTKANERLIPLLDRKCGVEILQHEPMLDFRGLAQQSEQLEIGVGKVADNDADSVL